MEQMISVILFSEIIRALLFNIWEINTLIIIMPIFNSHIQTK